MLYLLLQISHTYYLFCVAGCCSVLLAVAVCGSKLQCALIHEFASAAIHISFK